MKSMDLEKEAKLRLLKKLSDEMSKLMMEEGHDEDKEGMEMSDEIPHEESMQKVTVAAPDKEALKKGLDKALS